MPDDGLLSPRQGQVFYRSPDVGVHLLQLYSNLLSGQEKRARVDENQAALPLKRSVKNGSSRPISAQLLSAPMKQK